MAAPITLDEFFEMAQLGGRIQACHDIFGMMDECEDAEEFADRSTRYFENVNKQFKAAALKFKMGGGKVRMDEESIDGLGKEDGNDFKLV